MGLFRKASIGLQARVNKVLNTLEDPNALLDLSYEKMIDALQEVKRSLVDIVTQQKKLESELRIARKHVDEHQREAIASLKIGREDLAKQALELKQATITRVQQLEDSYEQVTELVERRKVSETKLRERLESFRLQKEITKANYSSARAEVKIGESMSGIGKRIGNANEAMQRATEKTDHMLARARAINSLTDEGILNDSLDLHTSAERELENIRRSDAVGEELERLKQGLNR